MQARLLTMIEAEAQRMGETLDLQAIRHIAVYLELLGRWNDRIRLTANADATALIGRHLPDALALVALLPLGHTLRCIDVGSGGGLPGLLAAIMRPEIELTLVEANSRKCSFLRTASYELGLSCDVRADRIERLIRAHVEPADAASRLCTPFDIAWSRAAFPPAKWLSIAPLLVGPGAQIVVFVARPPYAYPEGLPIERVVDYTLADRSPRSMIVHRLAAQPQHPDAP